MAKFLRCIVNIFLIVTILVAAVILIPPVAGVTTTIVDTETMDTNLPLGSITYSKDIAVTDIQSGDKILKETSSSTYLYVVQSGDAATGNFKALNGTGSNASEEEIVLRNNVSRVIVSVPYIGYVLVAMHSMEGLIIIGLVLIFMIVLFILSELWKKDDDENDDDDYDDEDDDDDEYDDEEVDAVDIKNKNLTARDSKEEKKQAKKREKARARRAKEQAKQDKLDQKLAKKEARKAKKQAAYDEEYDAFYAEGSQDEEEAWTRPVYTEESDDVLPERSEPDLSETGTLLDTREIELRELENQLGIDRHAAEPVEEDSCDAASIIEETVSRSVAANERMTAYGEYTDMDQTVEESGEAPMSWEKSEEGAQGDAEGIAAAALEEETEEAAEEVTEAVPESAFEEENVEAEQAETVEEVYTGQTAEEVFAEPAAAVEAVEEASAEPTTAVEAVEATSVEPSAENEAAENSPVSSAERIDAVRESATIVEEVTETADVIEEVPEAAAEPVVEEPVIEEPEDSFVPVDRPTLDELIEEAEKNNESPSLIKDADTGVTLVDYTDII